MYTSLATLLSATLVTLRYSTLYAIYTSLATLLSAILATLRYSTLYAMYTSLATLLSATLVTLRYSTLYAMYATLATLLSATPATPRYSQLLYARATLGEHSSNLQTSRVKREPFAMHLAKIQSPKMSPQHNHAQMPRDPRTSKILNSSPFHLLTKSHPPIKSLLQAPYVALSCTMPPI